MTNDREDLEARIAAYIDGELSPADAARLEVFLANTDPQLAEQVIGMIGDRHQLRGLPKTRAPEELAARIVEQVERATLLHHVEHARPWWQSRLALAAAVLLVLGSFSYFIMEALHPANPAWQAAVDSQRAPTPALAIAPLPPPEPSPEAAHPVLGKAAATAPTPPRSPQLATNSHVLLTFAAQAPDDLSRLQAALDDLASSAGKKESRRLKPMLEAATQELAASTEPALDRPVKALADHKALTAGELPLVYHLTLRPEQLHQLTQQFQVQTLTRDNQPFPLPAATTQPAPDAAPVECIITIALPAIPPAPQSSTAP
jgi:hypothetical protein